MNHPLNLAVSQVRVLALNHLRYLQVFHRAYLALSHHRFRPLNRVEFQLALQVVSHQGIPHRGPPRNQLDGLVVFLLRDLQVLRHLNLARIHRQNHLAFRLCIRPRDHQ